VVNLFWFHRDLRTADHPALVAAGTEVAPVVLQSALDGLEGERRNSLVASWHSLNESLDGQLTVVTDLVRAAKDLGVEAVFTSRRFEPAGIAEQQAAEQALTAHGIRLVVGPGNYAVSPGQVAKPDGTPYRVYTPFFKAWFAIGWSKPVPRLAGVNWQSAGGSALPEYRAIKVGEDFALRTFERFKERALLGYNEDRNRADLSGTSHLSHALAHGEVHPRTLLAELGDSPGEVTFMKELAWREFYADVLFHNPHTVSEYYEPRFAKLRYDFDEAKFEAWKFGQTGYPMVDAGMRQLLTTGWMHNRVRMIVASFLVKDLHIEWQHGADWFEKHLTDFDVASNSHGWQWTAGCGTDASPYYRVFNPVMQGYKFDPEGNYVRKFIPELRNIPGPEVHEPWLLLSSLSEGYPAPIVDHALERVEALARLEELKNREVE
jgi:deoxyribodipyrimidine photo-lyase